MIDETLESQYVVSKLRSNLPDLLESWSQRSAGYRNSANALLDRAYGDNERQKFDLFHCGKSGAPVLVYIHGGYWQRGDKSMYSFIADAFVDSHVNVAVLGYPICPQVSLTELVDSVRKALVYLYSHAAELNINRDRFNICGSSAGGHLVAMMMATKWSEYSSGLADDLVKFGVPVSGLYDLQPLRFTSLNEAVNMDENEAAANSPQLLKPVSKTPMLITVGGAETPVFFTQMEGLVKGWQTQAGEITQHIEDNADHFDMIERIGDPRSELFQQIISRLR